MKINWKQIIYILTGITLGYSLFGCKSSKNGCDAYSLQWAQEVDSLIVYKDDEIFLPKIQANNAKQMHFNNMEKGIYVVNLLKNGEVIETKKLTINK
jgi:hypothetical protein